MPNFFNILDFDAASFSAVVLGISGDIPAGPSAQAGDLPIPLPHNAVLRRMKLIAKSAVSVVKTAQLRRSTDNGNTYADITGFIASLDPAISGGRVATAVDPTDVDVNENDLLQISLTDGNASSGADLATIVVYDVRQT